MQFSCYSCGYVFHHGIPPLEALSQAQASVVGGVEDAPQRFITQGKFEGMSRYSFCSFCLMALDDYPEAINNKGSFPGHEMGISIVVEDDVVCECGERDRFITDRFVRHNRWMIKHLADIFYPGHELDIEMGMRYMARRSRYTVLTQCDWCEDEKMCREMFEPVTGEAVLAICEECDAQPPKSYMPDDPEEHF